MAPPPTKPPDNRKLQPHAWWRPASVRLAYKQIPRSVRLVTEADGVSAIGIVVLGFVGAGVPLAMAWVGKLIIDGVLLAMKSKQSADLERVLWLVALELGLMVAMGLIGRTAGLLRSVLGARLAYHIRQRILDKALTLELAHFENPQIYDRLQNARREASARPLNVFINTTGLVKDSITLASYSAVLAAFSPLAVVILILATIPSLLAEARLSGEAFRLFSWRAPEGRKMRYLEWLITRDTNIKEVQLYGLGDWLMARYRELYLKFFGEERTLAIKRATYGFAFSLLATVALYGCYGWIVMRTVEGALTLGEMTMYLTIFRQGQGSLRAILSSLGSTYEDNLFMSNLFAYLDLEVRPSLPATTRAAATEQSGFVLEGVSFRYPGKRAWALEDVSLRIGSTEKVAIIGDNGAGKTTLIKLLTGLYEPSQGVITLDGQRLSQLPKDELRARFGVVLQDYVQYQFTVRDNVALGQVDAMDDQGRIERAAELGGAEAVVEQLPNGWDTQLGRWFDGGAELSTGQWQKLAVSRAFMRDAPILILDEPTASLDAEAEYELFERFRSLTSGKMAILISHRFSTVRMADRIIVMRNGRIEEVGSHEELLARDGRYAHLFRIQAQGYLDAFA